MELLAMEQGYAENYLDVICSATEQQAQAAEKMFRDEEPSSIMQRDPWGENATITITGPLSPNGPDWLDRLFGFGGTSYKEIIKAADELRADAAIKKVTLIMDTPGGYVSGVDGAREALAQLAKEKNVVAENHGMIASAGYYLASAADTIIAKDRFAKTGSIGVIVSGTDYSKALESRGVKRFKIVSSNAPKKQPDPTTEAGKKIIQEEIDATERVFIHTIADGRGVTPDYVIENFGKGGLLIAEDPDQEKPSAVSVGMIDRVEFGASSAETEGDEVAHSKNEEIGYNDNKGKNKASAALDQTNEEKKNMNLAQLKADHPQLYAETVALGVSQERERVSAHLILGEASGDMDLAVASVKSGDEVSAVINAKHTAAHMKRAEASDRETENVGDIDTNSDNTATDDEAMAKAVAKQLGVEIDG